MVLFQYLDNFPKIPVDLVNNSLIPNMPDIDYRYNIDYQTDHQKLTAGPSYVRWKLKPELLEWIKKHICDHFKIAGIQVMAKDVIPHSDRRPWAVNYVVDTGGSAVTTTFYKKTNCPVVVSPGTKILDSTDLEIFKQITIEPYRWHIFNAHVLHGVENIKHTRKAITIGGFGSVNPFDTLKMQQLPIYNILPR